MSVIGINSIRDKMAKAIIYGGGSAWFYLIKVLALANISNPALVYKCWFQQGKQWKEIKHGITIVKSLIFGSQLNLLFGINNEINKF